MALSKGKNHKDDFCKNTTKQNTPLSLKPKSHYGSSARHYEIQRREKEEGLRETSLLSTHVMSPFRSSKELEKNPPVRHRKSRIR